MGITERMHQVRSHLIAWGLQRVQGICVRLARGYQWRLAGQGEGQQEMTRVVLTHVYMQGMLRGMSRGAGCTVRDIRTAIQEREPQLQWSLWLSCLARASYVYGVLLAFYERDSLIAKGTSAIF